jgi:hypothetical protein
MRPRSGSEAVAHRVMTPGTYLRKRREAAALGVIQAAAELANLAMLPRATNQRSAIAIRLNAAEANELMLGAGELALIRDWAFPLDPKVYAQLVAIRADPHNPALPHPGLCGECACSWDDACQVTDYGHGCHWVERPSRHADGLCSACLRANAVTVEPVLVTQVEVAAA